MAQSNETSSSSIEQKAKRHRRSGKPSGQPTPQSTPSADVPMEVEAEKVEKKEPTEAEKREKLLFEANALLLDSIARFRELGVQVITINETLSGVPVAWFRLQGCKFEKPRTEDTTIALTPDGRAQNLPSANPA